jgi:serine protease
VSPRLPHGPLLALFALVTAASAVLVADPATASLVTPARPAAPVASTAKADKIRHSEWWLSSMHVTQAWPSSRGSGVTVALLSTGVRASHPDLAGSVTTGPDYTGTGETSASDDWGIEGTSAASIIAGHGDNTGDASGIIGIAPAARILSVRVAFDAADPLNNSATDVARLPDAIAQGIRYAVAQGAKVIDLPLDPSTLASDGAATGGLAAAAGGSAEERSAVSYAVSKGVVLVAPAGDNGDDGDTPSVPASYPGVIALGAVDRHGAQAVFSARQSYVALTAPGSGVTAASQPSGYRNMSTTDAASAMAAGITALIRSRYPGLTSSQVRQALITGSVRSSSASGTASATQAGAGAGTVDALKAIQAAAAIANPQPTARPSSPAASPAVVAPLTTPLTAQSKPSTVGMAKSALRDAAYAAGGLIVLLLGVLLGLRLWRRRSGRQSRSPAEPRTLLEAPTGPPSGPLPIQASARHARAGEELAFTPAAPFPVAAAAVEPVAVAVPAVHIPEPAGSLATGSRDARRVPDSVSPRFAPPGMLPMEPDILDDPLGRTADPEPAAGGPGSGPGDPAAAQGRPRKGRAGRSAAARTASQSQLTPPGGPPWERATAPADQPLQEPWSRPPDPFSLAGRPASIPPVPWDTSGRGLSGPDRPELPRRGSGLTGPDPLSADPLAGGPLGADPLSADPLAGGPITGPIVRPAAGGSPPMAWQPIPPGGTPPPGIPAPPAGLYGPATGTPTPPEGIPVAPLGGLGDPGGLGPLGSPDPLSGPDSLSGPGGPRPISPRDRLPLEELAAPRPAAPLPPPPPPPPAAAGPPPPWRIPGSSGRFPGAGEESPAPGAPAEPGDPGSPRDGYPGRTGRLSRAGEFLPPYAGRPDPDDEPEPGPAPEGPPQATQPTGVWTEESPSGPLYIWNPAALTEPFPNSPAPPATPAPPEADGDHGPHHHRA